VYGLADSPVAPAAWMLNHDAASCSDIAAAFAGHPRQPRAAPKAGTARSSTGPSPRRSCSRRTGTAPGPERPGSTSAQYRYVGERNRPGRFAQRAAD